jgi:hypothetical protein
MMERLRNEGNPRRGGDVADALGTIERSGLSSRAVVDYLSVNGGNDRQVMSRMADASIAPGISPQAAAAFRTIGIAQPSARTSGINLWQSRQPGSGAAPPSNSPGIGQNGNGGRSAGGEQGQRGPRPSTEPPEQPARNPSEGQEPPTSTPREGSSE